MSVNETELPRLHRELLSPGKGHHWWIVRGEDDSLEYMSGGYQGRYWWERSRWDARRWAPSNKRGAQKVLAELMGGFEK
jgi:hypothetical protein